MTAIPEEHGSYAKHLLQSAASPQSDTSYCFFFFSSRRRHTRFKCDWSSGVCSSDLCPANSRSAVGRRTPRLQRKEYARRTGCLPDTPGRVQTTSRRLASLLLALRWKDRKSVV